MQHIITYPSANLDNDSTHHVIQPVFGMTYDVLSKMLNLLMSHKSD